MDFSLTSALERLRIDRQLQNRLTDALGKFRIVVVSVEDITSDRRTQANLELERFASDEGGGYRLQHVEGSPMTRQALDKKRHDWSAGFVCGDCGAGVPCLFHMPVEIGVRRAHRKDAQNGLFAVERFGIS